MMMRLVYLWCLFLTGWVDIKAQCLTPISSFPYIQDFEATDGGWINNGVAGDWEWGTPTKSIISSAGGGSKCWVTGGLTPGPYNNGEASWLQGPCFDFTTLQYPYVSMKVFWETERQFDGAAFQYSINGGNTWVTVGTINSSDCLNKNWYNYDPITYLAVLTPDRQGWSGSKLPTSGSCRGGNGSNGWVTASHTIPALAGRSSVIFRFIFGAGTICNDFDGFAVDDLWIGDAPPNDASFTYKCANSTTVDFTNTSALCPNSFTWDFGDPASGTNNTATTSNPSHTFSSTGEYTVTLTVAGPGNAPSTTTRKVIVITGVTDMLSPADCQTNDGGSLILSVEGTSLPLNLAWSTSPVQTTTIATNLAAGNYTVTITGTDVCPLTVPGKVEVDLSCIGIFFPSGFTPNNDQRNNTFGPLGSLAALSNYKLSIYNRWGERVFFSTNPFQKWDGTVKTLKTDGNVFIWMAEFSLAGKPKEFRKGTVVLIR